MSELTGQCFARVIREVSSRLTQAGEHDVLNSLEWIKSVNDMQGDLMGVGGASGNFGRALTAIKMGVWRPEDAQQDGVVMLGAVRFQPVKADPRQSPIPNFQKKRGSGLSVSAIKDFLTEHTPLSRYVGRMNLYAGKFQDIELGEIVSDLRQEIWKDYQS